MSKGVRLSLALVGIAALVIVALFAFSSRDSGDQDATQDTGLSQEPFNPELVRADSPVLSEGTEAVFVEFLDFECEACLAVYPAIEDLREEYGDRISFVVRHMPLHGNSMNAALAAEAAAEQGMFEEMYQRLFESSEEWSHQQASMQETFFGYAAELGLDMEQFEADFNSDYLSQRIDQSVQDGLALGVQGTPTFFLDGEMLNPQSLEDLEAAFDAALGE